MTDEGLVAPVGEGLGALVILLTFGLGISLRHLLWLYLVVLLTWVWVVLSLRGHAGPSVGQPA